MRLDEIWCLYGARTAQVQLLGNTVSARFTHHLLHIGAEVACIEVWGTRV